MFPGGARRCFTIGKHRVLLLFYLPIYVISGGQFRCSGGNCLLLIGIHTFWIGADSQFSPLLKRGDGVVQYSLTPGYGILSR